VKRAPGGASIVSVLAAIAMVVGCAVAPQATSFETLGVPEPAGVAGRTAVVLGWADEARAGWTVDRVKIDDRFRPEWDAETQRPAVFYLHPGPRALKIYSSRGGDDIQRVRSRPARFEAVADGVVVCTVRVRADESPLPRLSCEVSGARSEPTAAPAVDAPPPPPPPAPDPTAERIVERLQAIEDRLGRLEELLRTRLPGTGDGARTAPPPDTRRPLSIDTTPPW